MTNEEAIEVLAQNLPCETDEDLSEAMTMAIKALEQQPCEDAISRQAALDLFNYTNTKGDVWHGIKDLPSVTPKEKTGMWINDWEMGMSECSCCGENYLWEDHKGTENFHYCPNCGARMQEVEENG